MLLRSEALVNRMANDLNGVVAIAMNHKAGDDDHRLVHHTADHMDAALSLCVLGLPTFIDNKSNGLISMIALLPKKKPRGAKQQQRKAPVVGGTPSRKNSTKPKDPKRDTSVPFDEMKRLMQVYGPAKTLRKSNRASNDDIEAARPASIRRKFYRWFPDFRERFVKSPVDGRYAPKAGHWEEMRYREAMRKMDEEILAKKRNDKRCNYGITKPFERLDPSAGFAKGQRARIQGLWDSQKHFNH